MVPYRSSFAFPARLHCFDPRASLLRAGVLLCILSLVLFLVPSSVYVAAAALVAAVCGSFVLSGRDRRRFACTSLLLTGCRLLDLEERDDGVHGVLVAGSGAIGGLRPRMRLASPQPVRSGMRRIPVTVSRKGSVTRWHDEENDVSLETREEVLGALGVVARGDGVGAEVLYGARAGEQAKVLAVRFFSSEGAVQSWDGALLEDPGHGFLDKVLPRAWAERRSEVPAE